MLHDKKLVLFDIDGTLIRPLAAVEAIKRFPYAIKKVFGKTVPSSAAMWRTFNGWSDRSILWAHMESTGVSKETFLSRLGALEDAFVEFLDHASQNQKLYEAIEEARIVFDLIHKSDQLILGTLTGNLHKSASWKLSHAGINRDHFQIGVYGDEADLREDLARLIIVKSRSVLGLSFPPTDVIFIGDTVHDIRCARAIGARVIAVTTGWNIPKADLKREKPDLLVDSLLDERVLKLLGLE